MLLFFPRAHSKCSAVLAAPARAANHPRLFRSYRSSYDNISIWEAACVTMSRPGMFNSIWIGMPGAEEEFIGCVGFSNPADYTIKEAKTRYGRVFPITSFLSLGTGKGPRVALPPGDVT